MVLNQIDWSDAYGERVESLFQDTQDLVVPAAEAFVRAFYGDLTHSDTIIPILDRLAPEQFERLQGRQVEHFKMLMSPGLTFARHLDVSRRIGRVHAMVGVDLLWLIEAYSLYQRNIQDVVQARPLPPDRYNAFMWAVSRRLTVDMQAQAESYQQLERDGTRALSQIDQLLVTADSLPDLLTGVMKIFDDLDGLLGAFIARPNARGQMQVEIASTGPVQTYLEAMQAGDIPAMSIHGDETAGRGPAGKAWRSGRVERTDNYEVDASMRPWGRLGNKLGFRSSVAIPLLDEAGQAVAILSLYSDWVGYFSTTARQAFLGHIQQVLSLAILRFRRRRVIPYTERHHYRRLLEMRQVVMLYQPIVDMRRGTLRKVEALARLRDDDGRLISPYNFLPAFGNVDLLHLFEHGLEQACEDMQYWRAQGLTTEMAINFPPQGISDQRYQEVLLAAVQAGRLDPRQLHLEILESEDTEDAVRDYFITQLQGLGIRFAQDDLGAGHSTLLRMDSFPFDEIKIDQGLVRGGMNKPQRALEFVRHLTRLGHDLQTMVTVEGLENDGLVEAAAILGADSGQGYAIARPLPAAELPSWYAGFEIALEPFKPRTVLGALAGYLLWDKQLEILSDWPWLVEDFVNSPCAVRQFIDFNGLDGSALDELLKRTHAAALKGHASAHYVNTREKLLECLVGQVVN